MPLYIPPIKIQTSVSSMNIIQAEGPSGVITEGTPFPIQPIIRIAGTI